MWKVALAAAGSIIGGSFGVTAMCLFQINRDKHYTYRKNNDKSEEKKHSEDR